MASFSSKNRLHPHLAFLLPVMEGPAFQNPKFSFPPPRDKPPDEIPSSGIPDDGVRSSENPVVEADSYKNKILNRFGEIATQKIHETSSLLSSRQSGPQTMIQDNQISEIEDGVGVVIPLSDEE